MSEDILIVQETITQLVEVQEDAPLLIEVSAIKGDLGYSAYELAVQGGFVGTKEQWLLSLEGAIGATGPIGPIGPIGADGTGGDLNYVHTQAIPEATWTIPHNLGKFPNVVVLDSAGTVVIGEIYYNSLLAITLVFTSGFSGKAYLN